jgi:leader peptidase (prepilin peptidase)/N-methyltransferase
MDIHKLSSDEWMTIWIIASAVFGLMIGSFLNVVIWRVPNKMSIVKGGSMCPNCKASLTVRDNIPLFSYLFLRGKCRHCNNRISAQYPIIEALTSVVWVLTTWRVGLHAYTFGYLIFFSGLIALSIIDIKTKLLPNKIVYPTGIALVLITSIWAVANGEYEILRNCFIVGAAYFALLGALWFASNGKAMGFGDVRLAFFLGFSMGLYGFLIPYIGMLLAFALGAVIGLLVITVTKSGRKTKIPFGPFLAMGTIIVIWCATWLASVIELPNV